MADDRDKICAFCRFCQIDVRNHGFSFEHIAYTDRCTCGCPQKPNITFWAFESFEASP